MKIAMVFKAAYHQADWLYIPLYIDFPEQPAAVSIFFGVGLCIGRMVVWDEQTGLMWHHQERPTKNN